MLILYLASLLYLVIISNSFLVDSLGFSIYKIMSSAKNSLKNDNFTPSFPIWISFISLSWLIALARTSITVLNESGTSRSPCLVLVLREITFSSSYRV
uniref:Uncharacterized protein n=1 Tax=Equus asinus TaxID=9793 RepID=A0A9L0KD41_EQUAS